MGWYYRWGLKSQGNGRVEIVVKRVEGGRWVMGISGSLGSVVVLDVRSL